MGICAVHVRFDGEPPSQATIDEELRRRAGPQQGLSGYRREGDVLRLLVSLDPITLPYLLHVVRELGGTRLRFGTNGPVEEPLPAFVAKPWAEHDEATRRAVIDDFERSIGLAAPSGVVDFDDDETAPG